MKSAFKDEHPFGVYLSNSLPALPFSSWMMPGKIYVLSLKHCWAETLSAACAYVMILVPAWVV